jgi:hypothetical protein
MRWRGPAAVGTAEAGPLGGGHSFHGGGSGGGGGFIAVLIIVLLIYIFYRRSQRGGLAASAGPAPTAQAAVMSVLGAALGQGAAMGAATGSMGQRSAARRSVRDDAAARRRSDPRTGSGIRARSVPAARGDDVLSGQARHSAKRRRGGAPFLERCGVRAGRPRPRRVRRTASTRVAREPERARRARAERAECDEAGQRLQVHFDLVYRAKVLDDTNQVSPTSKPITGTASAGRSRARRVRVTPTNGGVTAARCPACGAELRLNLDGTCAHCRASVTNGTVDWIVAGVEQAPFVGYPNDSSLAVAAPSVGQGIATLQAADPASRRTLFGCASGRPSSPCRMRGASRISTPGARS